MKKRSLYFKFALLFIVALYFAFMLYHDGRENAFDHERYAQEHSVSDLETYSQDLLFYAKDLGDDLLVSKQASEKYKEDFYTKYYSVWKNNVKFTEQAELKRVFDRKSFGYAENLKVWDSAKWNKIKENALLESYPNSSKQAITLRETALRAIPSMSPLYLEVGTLSNAYPFDMLQYSHLPLALPLYVSHISADKAWYFIETGNASGWVQSSDIAFVDNKFIENWHSYDLVSIIREESVLELEGRFFASSSIGTLLPTKEGKVYVPVQLLNLETILYPVEIKDENYKSFPLDFTAKQVAELGQEMMGQSYGWGGLGGNRDCSLMLQDLFINFAIHLPRNSALQAQIGEKITLTQDENKEEEIINIAKPFASFIFKKGHIMLYIGSYNSKALVFHNAWGIVAKNNERILLGKAVVTSLEAGSENPRAEKSKSLLTTVESVNLL